VLVALDHKNPVAVTLLRWDDANRFGHIGFLVGDPDAIEITGKLVDEAVSILLEKRCETVGTDDRCPFGIGWIGIPEPWEHIDRILSDRSFAIDDDWILMTGRTDVPDLDDIEKQPPEWILLWTGDEKRLEWRLELYFEEKVAAECHMWGVPPHLRHCPGFDGWVTVEWVGVIPEARRQGFARWLLSRQFRHQASAKRNHVMLWTGPGNQNARKLYHDLGFIDGPQTFIYRRSL